MWIVVSHENITVRKQIEESLRESEKRYHALFEDMPISIWEEDFSEAKKYLDSLKIQGITDLGAFFKANPDALYESASMIKVIDVNQATIKMYGAGSKEDLYRSMDTGLNKSEMEHISDALIAIYEGKTGHGWEGPDETLSGEPVEISLNWNVAPGHEDDFSKVIVTTIDVTERKHSEQILQTSEKRFRSLIANTGDLIITVDSQGIIQFVSPSSERILGYKPEDAVGQKFMDWVHPDDLPEVLNALSRVLLGPGVVFDSIEVRGMHKDGSWHVLDAIGTNLINEPAIQGIVLNIRDVTERKLTEEALRASEAQFRAIFEGAAIGIALVDTSGHSIKSNSALEELLGYDAEKLRNMAFTDFTHPDDSNTDWNLWQELMRGEREYYQIEKRFVHKNGQIVWGKLTSSIVQGADGTVLFGVGMVEDITERKKAEAESKYQLAELEALYENGLAISRLLEPKQIAQRMAEVIEQKLDWHHAAIRLYDAKTDRLELLALNSPGFSAAQLTEQIERINQAINTPDKGLSGWVIRHGEVARIGNLKDDPRYLETYPGIKSGLYVPIQSGSEIIGSIAIESEEENAFSERDAYTLTTLANQAAISFINARLYLIVQKELDERLRAEEEVRKLNVELEQRVADRTAQIETTKRRLELATHAGQIGVWEYIPTENKVIWDERMYMIHQIPTGEFAGTSEAWDEMIHPDDLAQLRLDRQLTQNRNLIMNNEHRIILSDGSLRHISASAIMSYSTDGMAERIIGINIDITERKQIEQSLRDSETYARLLFDAIPVPVSVVEADGSIMNVNHEFEKQYNISRDGISGKQISELEIFPESDMEKREQYIAEILQGKDVKPVELNYYVPGERPHILQLHSYLLKIYGRQLVLNTSHDITAFKKTEEAQRIAKAEMERALRIKNEFLANMSHELRTPLNSILGISESLEEQIAGALNEKQLKYISIVRESGRHLLDLINDILDLSKIEAGQMKLDIHPISVDKLCQTSLRLVKELAQKKSLNITYKLDEKVGLISGDERRLKQSLVNLLSNAVKFTHPGSRIGLEVTGNMEKNEIEFTVWDQGIGIAKQDIERLFKPFVQLDAGLTREYQGTGLGLALVSQMAQLHGGHARVESELGSGSRFTITLPWPPSEQTAKAKVTAQFLQPSKKSNLKRNGKILLVEDTDLVVQLISEYLRYKGYEVLLAHNGAEGVEVAMEEHPDLILMDVMMPIMNGLEATEKLRTEDAMKNTPIIAMTALAMSGDSERCLAAGMNDYLSKPIQMQSLADMIEKHLGPAKDKINEK
jgi:PAS domain S-box-containing protein